jgi:hypothetical protein
LILTLRCGDERSEVPACGRGLAALGMTIVFPKLAKIVGVEQRYVRMTVWPVSSKRLRQRILRQATMSSMRTM